LKPNFSIKKLFELCQHVPHSLRSIHRPSNFSTLTFQLTDKRRENSVESEDRM
jgi:hypothetical protein